jgi:hypothetical protein
MYVLNSLLSVFCSHMTQFTLPDGYEVLGFLTKVIHGPTTNQIRLSNSPKAVQRNMVQSELSLPLEVAKVTSIDISYTNITRCQSCEDQVCQVKPN